MHSTLISTVGYVAFHISTCGQSLAASLYASRATVSSHPTAIEFTTPTKASYLGYITERSISSANHSHSESSQIERRDMKQRNGKKHAKRNRINSSCPPRKSKPDAALSVGANSGGVTSADDKSGDATYYGTGLGACGIVHNDGHMIAAASHLLFDAFPGATANPNLNPICGRKVKATYEGKSVEVQIVDRCTGCALYDLDFSPTAFAQLGLMEKGRLHGMKWEWIDAAPSGDFNSSSVNVKLPEAPVVVKLPETPVAVKLPDAPVVDPTPLIAPSADRATLGDAKSGDATYYGTGLGACGIVSNDDHMIAAASHLLFDTFPGATANPNLNPICGRKVKATYEGKSVEVQIVDRCTGCAMHDLDFSPTAFAQLGLMEKGRLHGMKWDWM